MTPHDPQPVEDIPSLPDHSSPGGESSSTGTVGSPPDSGLVEPGTAVSDRPEGGDGDEQEHDESSDRATSQPREKG